MTPIQRERNRRLKHIFGLLAFFLFIIVARLFQLQVDQKFFLAKKAMKQYIHLEKIKPLRGIFYDRHKKPLVFNQEAWDLAEIPAIKMNKLKLKNEDSHFRWIKRGATTEEKDTLCQSRPDLTVFPSFCRKYLYPHCNHLLGFVDIDMHGLAGLELSCNTLLKGEEGFVKGLKNAKNKGAFFEQLQSEKVINGAEIYLTIDESLQRIIYDAVSEKVKELNAKQGAALLLEPSSGEILAMVSYPNFDPLHLSQESIANTHNIPIESAFEAGSVCKVFLALAALDERIVTPETEIDCQGRQAKIGGILVQHPASLGAPMGIVPFSQVIQKSNNIGVAKVGFELGDRLYHQYKKMGLGKKTMIQLPAEQAGRLRPPKEWSLSTPVALSFGYEVSITLLQLAQVFAMIANHGVSIEPDIIKKNRACKKTQLYDAELIDSLKSILEPIGRLCKVDGYTIFGKTGTARLLKEGSYSNKDHLYTFAGIIEKNDYKRVLITMIKEPSDPHLLAVNVTVPLFKTILERISIADQQNNTYFE